MSLSAPSRRGGPTKGGARRSENNKIYAHPLPVIVEPAPSSYITRILDFFGISSARVLNPHCTGVYDPDTRSVWVTDPGDAIILWRRGFFGKGDLSRSEPSWQKRQIGARKAAAGKYMTAEEIREKRRAERQQFKLDRAAAMAQASAEAEAAFAEGREANITTVIPSGATWKPQQSVTGEAPSPSPSPIPEQEPVDEAEEEPISDLEHLQLTLQEAFFLAWTLDCLTILDPTTSEPMILEQIWQVFQSAHHIRQVPPDVYARRFDNPFLVHYAAYHYYRSLGWVIKGGIKFCVDFLLYKRGPVFHHAEFAVIVLPVYEDPADQESSPFDLANSAPFSWTWLSTINRVNSQVQKTLILTYVTIPARSRISPELLSSPTCLEQYSVRDVVLRRFIPARMRD
ncbi:uncharacterized protein LAESUDRAFT_734985 [Laetiporus sulphureus 93-53]|uniref:tRNA-splicing endonuclease subunit Sen2 n=1 Tax=Laetiporus sulphureus 93-53 TaxID=1314785 RepID=A0A165G780_9APHY|nr:uncharacterized protein LAESUDRAFT_734985 [Laetiporus sulphureus 93-53]KZT09924.1 hypothetical protein LAESUDRAFT_734985 [Laetiporus sulphureus 93-53]